MRDSVVVACINDGCDAQSVRRVIRRQRLGPSVYQRLQPMCERCGWEMSVEEEFVPNVRREAESAFLGLLRGVQETEDKTVNEEDTFDSPVRKRT